MSDLKLLSSDQDEGNGPALDRDQDVFLCLCQSSETGVREDLQIAGLSYTWWRKSQDRAGWRAAIECLLQRT